MSELPEYDLPPISSIPDLTPAKRRKRVVIVASPCSDPLELIGPMTVFQVANLVLANSGRSEVGYDLEFVSSQVGSIFETKGLKLLTDSPYNGLRGKVDTLVLTPMDFAVLFSGQDRFLAWVAKYSQRVRRLVSICAGAYILAEAGVLTGKRASTHWDLVRDFKARYPDVRLDPKPIFTKDGHIYTSAGMTAGLDLIVALVEEDFGSSVALRTAQAMVFFLKRPGGQAQFSTQLAHGLPENTEIAQLQNFIYEHIGEDLHVEKLAQHVNMSPRNFSRKFRNEVGLSPGKYVELCRLELARQKLEQSSLPLPKIARICGYRTMSGMHLAFERHLGLSPTKYRERFSSAAS